MRVGIERIRRLRKRGLITRRQARELVRHQLRMLRARRRGRAAPRCGVDVFQEQQARMLSGESTEADSLLQLKRRLIWVPLQFGFLPLVVVLWPYLFPGRWRIAMLDAAQMAGAGVVGGFLFYAICMAAVAGPRLRKTAAWIRALEEGPTNLSG